MPPDLNRQRPVLITGASGLIGSALRSALLNAGYEVRTLTRNQKEKQENSFYWNPQSGELDSTALDGVSAIIHLAGAPIADRRWSESRKRIIEESRVSSTKLLVDTITKAKGSVEHFLSASAIGYYGNTGEQLATEEDPPFSDLFVSTSTRRWEEASMLLKDSGVRLAHLRFGVVLSPAGGALKKMLLPFLFGAGGKIGSGKQWMSWIAIDDVVAAILHVLNQKDITGPVNFVAPVPVTNAEFSRTLARVLKRPCIFPLPAPLVKLIFGQMGEELLLASVGVQPGVLEKSGYKFLYPELEPALRYLLKR